MNLLFAWRYFRSKKSTNAINIIAWISMTAIAVGSAALIIVLSVFNGFEDLVKGLYADFYADMRVAPARGKTFHISPEKIQALKNQPGVAAISFIAEEKAVLNGAFQTIISLKGVDDQYTRVTKVNTPQHMPRGKFNLGTVDAPGLVVGGGIENAGGVDVDRQVPVTIYLPNRQAARLTGSDGLNAYNAVPTGTFVIQQDFDNKYAFSNLSFVKYMLGMSEDEFSYIEMKTTGDAEKRQRTIQRTLGKGYLVETRYEQNKSLYAVMQVEKWVIYGILSLILVVAAFNMIGALTMLVLEKQKDIAVLKAMGASDAKLQRIFLTEGILLACLGGGAGILLAALFCWLQLRFKLISLGGNTFIIDYYPVKMLPADFLLVTATILLISVLAAWLPARKASAQFVSLKS
ncbi:FtsX-like permease family protein [Sediminibacterium soli]|uniref:FtsX-like permease family protein n=1 Tax=Sediminibacterium soli TaxID=2698829 RepID=UPI001379D704|nr:FtsX-like permease family protein [Sediminibacterium soli]NCI47321.1 ABC transporter permease [Sediminibacterium soli]